MHSMGAQVTLEDAVLPLNINPACAVMMVQSYSSVTRVQASQGSARYQPRMAPGSLRAPGLSEPQLQRVRRH